MKVYELRYIDVADFYQHYDEHVGYFSTYENAIAAAKSHEKWYRFMKINPMPHEEGCYWFTIKTFELVVDGKPIGGAA